MLRVYYRQAIACIIVFDLTRKETFEVRRAFPSVRNLVASGEGHQHTKPAILLLERAQMEGRPRRQGEAAERQLAAVPSAWKQGGWGP
jgi:hypothetical protein